MPKQYHKNPRQITTKQMTMLAHDLAELGDLSGIVHDLNSDEIIGGNQRSKIFRLDECEIVLSEEYDKPDEQGTVGLGYVIWQGKKYTYRAVRWDAKTAEKANIVANKAGGTWDFDILADNFELDELLEWGFEPFELGLDDSGDAGDGEIDETYSREIKSPAYEITGDKPEVSALFDDTRTKQLIADIDANESIPEADKAFLRVAAQRHTVLRFDRIAEYYAHASEELQALMEDSALVIIDFGKAIELGYVKLSEEIAQLYGEDFPDA